MIVNPSLTISVVKEQLVATNTFQLTVTVSQYQYIPREIFLYERGLDTVDTFVAVCTPVQIETYAANSPAVGQVYWRDEQIVLVFGTLAELETAIAQIEADLTTLVVDYKAYLNQVTWTYSKTFTPPA